MSSLESPLPAFIIFEQQNRGYLHVNIMIWTGLSVPYTIVAALNPHLCQGSTFLQELLFAMRHGEIVTPPGTSPFLTR
ncbi:hypothetical protein HYDPIDRAFT_34152 [Hydnomerulius pinastri MD-312]|uniref:Helitron helicase-like domain-containing protein n=1 Tax=Hydnomerulius pinastri MD-312 TaxID=994086 RepID=A0A0C9UZL8_9AGAM|nr:hypothetical protein HYDPIDRAFT_34152 [Hydnomerulius pinastri MD-312]